MREGAGMKEFKDGADTSSTPPKETQASRMQKPPIHTTKYGTQYVNVMDIIESEVGWAEIKRLKDANLVQNPSSKNGDNSSTSSNGDVS
jgi:hypothetical protein